MSDNNKATASVLVKDLHAALTDAHRLVDHSRLLPALQLQVQPQGLTIKAFGTTTEYATRLTADTQGASDMLLGTLDAHAVRGLVATLDKNTTALLTLEPDGSQLHLQAGRVRGQWQGATNANNTNDEPEPAGALHAIHTLTLAGDDLAHALGVAYAAATADFQAVFRNVQLELHHDKGARLIATDGFRFATTALTLEPEVAAALPAEPINALIPGRVAPALARLTAGQDNITLTLEALGSENRKPSSLTITGGNWRYHVKLGDGAFPDWRRVLPNDADPDRLTLEVNKDELATLLGRLTLANESGIAPYRCDLTLELEGQETRLHGSSTASGKVGTAIADSLPVSVTHGDPRAFPSLAINTRYLRDAVANAPGDTVRLNVGQNAMAAVLVTNEQHIALVVPLRTV